MKFVSATMFENLVNYDKSKTILSEHGTETLFENLVNYDKSKTMTAKEMETKFV